MQELELWQRGLTLREIAEKLDTSHETVRQRLLETAEYKPAEDRRRRNRQIVYDFFNRDGDSVQDIADKYGLYRESVYHILKQEIPDYFEDKERFLQERNEAIILDYENGVSVQELVDRYSLSDNWIYHIVNS